MKQSSRFKILASIGVLFLILTLLLSIESAFFNSSFTLYEPRIEIYSELQNARIDEINKRIIFLEKRLSSLENASHLEINTDKDICVLDPLDDSCEHGLSNFDLDALTPERANFCDSLSVTHLSKDSEFKECIDPTCVSCRQGQISKSSKLSSVFHSMKSRHNRDKKSKLFEEDILIMSSVNYGQVYLFLNWACSCIANNVFDPRKFVYVVPTDAKTHQLLSSFGFIVEDLDWLAHAPRISESYKGGANVGGHTLINNILAFTTNYFIQKDFNVLLMDVDIVFLKDPFDYLRKASERRDVLGMFSPRNDAYGFMNSGFIFMRPTKKTKVLTQSLANMCLIKKQSDQQLWNALLRHKSMLQIEQRILPRHLFFTLWQSTSKHGYDEATTFLLHAVSVQKAKRLVKINQWHFKEECQFFDADVEMQTRDLNLYEK